MAYFVPDMRVDPSWRMSCWKTRTRPAFGTTASYREQAYYWIHSMAASLTFCLLFYLTKMLFPRPWSLRWDKAGIEKKWFSKIENEEKKTWIVMKLLSLPSGLAKVPSIWGLKYCPSEYFKNLRAKFMDVLKRRCTSAFHLNPPPRRPSWVALKYSHKAEYSRNIL